MSDVLIPHPGDPDGPHIVADFRLDDPGIAWVMSALGEYGVAAAYGFKDTGDRDSTLASMQPLVILQWPGRINKTNETVTVRMAMHPEDAVGLADGLRQSGEWMLRAEADRSAPAS